MVSILSSLWVLLWLAWQSDGVDAWKPLPLSVAVGRVGSLNLHGKFSRYYTLGVTAFDASDISKTITDKNISTGQTSLWHQTDVLLTIGQAGLTDAHINSLREYLNAHNTVKVKLSSSQLPITTAEVATQIQSALSAPSKSAVLSLLKATKAVEIGNIDIRGRCLLLQRLELLPEKSVRFSLNKNFKPEDRREKKIVHSQKVNAKKKGIHQHQAPREAIANSSPIKKKTSAMDGSDGKISSDKAVSRTFQRRRIASSNLQGRKSSKTPLSERKATTTAHDKHSRKSRFLSTSMVHGKRKSTKTLASVASSSSKITTTSGSVKEKLARFMSKKVSDQRKQPW